MTPDVIRLNALHANVDAGNILSGGDLDGTRPGKRERAWVISADGPNVRLAARGACVRYVVVRLSKEVVLAWREIGYAILPKVVDLIACTWTVPQLASHPQRKQHLNHAARYWVTISVDHFTRNYRLWSHGERQIRFLLRGIQFDHGSALIKTSCSIGGQ